MSNTYYETDKLSLTATVQGANMPYALQLTLGRGSYVFLSRDEQIALVSQLLLRIVGEVSATCESEKTLSSKISYAPIDYPSGVSTAGRLFKDDLKETFDLFFNSFEDDGAFSKDYIKKKLRDVAGKELVK